MKKSRFSEHQIISILKEVEAGLKVKGRLPPAWDKRTYLLPMEI